jgi:HAD superfamily hydrolase (TIGR01509 family)
MGLVTTAKAKSVSQVLRYHGLQDFFDHVVTGDDVEFTKPAPDGYLAAVAKFGSRLNETIAIEDSEAGVLAAKAAGIQCVRVASFEAE